MSGGANDTSLEELQSLLYQALGEPIGLVLATSDPKRARQKLYAARKALGDPALSRLQIRMSPFADGELDLVICKGEGAQAVPGTPGAPLPIT